MLGLSVWYVASAILRVMPFHFFSLFGELPHRVDKQWYTARQQTPRAAVVHFGDFRYTYTCMQSVRVQ